MSQISDREWSAAFDKLCDYFSVPKTVPPRAAVAQIIEGVERGNAWRREERDNAHKAQFERDLRRDLRAFQRAQQLSSEQVAEEIEKIKAQLAACTRGNAKET